MKRKIKQIISCLAMTLLCMMSTPVVEKSVIEPPKKFDWKAVVDKYTNLELPKTDFKFVWNHIEPPMQWAYLDYLSPALVASMDDSPSATIRMVDDWETARAGELEETEPDEERAIEIEDVPPVNETREVITEQLQEIDDSVDTVREYLDNIEDPEEALRIQQQLEEVVRLTAILACECNSLPSNDKPNTETNENEENELSEPLIEMANETEKNETEENETENEETDISDIVPLDDEVVEELVEVCKNENVPISYGLGLIETESRFNTSAVSVSGNYGLCQLHPAYFPSDLSPAMNVHYGISHLSNLHDEYGDWTKAFDAYNKGHVSGSTHYANTVLANASAWETKMAEAGIF